MAAGVAHGVAASGQDRSAAHSSAAASPGGATAARSGADGRIVARDDPTESRVTVAVPAPAAGNAVAAGRCSAARTPSGPSASPAECLARSTASAKQPAARSQPTRATDVTRQDSTPSSCAPRGESPFDAQIMPHLSLSPRRRSFQPHGRRRSRGAGRKKPRFTSRRRSARLNVARACGGHFEASRWAGHVAVLVLARGFLVESKCPRQPGTDAHDPKGDRAAGPCR